MIPGELAWFDPYYHAAPSSAAGVALADYALLCMILRKWDETEATELADYQENDYMYDIIIDGRIYPAPSGTLISAHRKNEKI